MVKLFFLCRRRPDLTREEYARCVLDGHVPLALKHHTTMKRYEVNIALEDPVGGEAFDSLPALCFESLSDFQERLYDSPESEAIIHADVQRFMGGSVAYATTEFVRKDERASTAKGTRSPGLKWVCLLERARGMSHEAFVAHWQDVHGPLALRHQPGISKYVQNVVDQRLSDAGDVWDGIAEIHYASPEERAKGRYAFPESKQVVRADIDRFVGRSVAYPVAEYIQK